MKEFFSSFFSSANIIERAKALIINAFALSRAHVNPNGYPGCRFACPGLRRSLGFQPASFASVISSSQDLQMIILRSDSDAV
ncbi:hypothetical protein, partial [Hallella sp.]|uniref:hypothetical protein n=1 Tax=Hallella sp. TaxID=2980186 RepID=UPI0030798956